MSQFNTTIDDSLLMQARQLTGMRSDRVLLEYALKIVIALRSVPQSLSAKKQNAQYSKISRDLSPTAFEAADAPSLYHGKPLSLEDMQTAVDNMAAQQT